MSDQHCRMVGFMVRSLAKDNLLPPKAVLSACWVSDQLPQNSGSPF